MNRRRRAVLHISVIGAVGLATALLGWSMGGKPVAIAAWSVVASFLAYAILNVPRPYRRHGWGQIQQAVDHSNAHSGGEYPDDPAPPERAVKVGRNDPCSCGSGLKYKQCCGAG